MRPGIDPKVDYVFKLLFGRERTVALLLHLLNAILQWGTRLTQVQLLNPFSDKDALDDKLSIVDVKARDQLGRIFHVEMQVLPERTFHSRLLYYWADLHRQQLSEGDSYSRVRPTISVCIANFVLFPEVADHRLEFELRNALHGLVFSQDMMLVTLELPKFKLDAEELASPLDAWLYFLQHAEDLDSEALPPAMQVPEIARAFEELNMVSQNDLNRERYQARVKMQRDQLSRLESAREEGRDEGRKEGREEGREKGREEGRKEELVGTIHLCQRLLKHPLTPPEQLLAQSLAELKQFAQHLEKDLPV